MAYVWVPKLPPGYLARVGVRGRADAVRPGSNPSGAALAALALLAIVGIGGGVSGGVLGFATLAVHRTA